MNKPRLSLRPCAADWSFPVEGLQVPYPGPWWCIIRATLVWLSTSHLPRMPSSDEWGTWTALFGGVSSVHSSLFLPRKVFIKLLASGLFVPTRVWSAEIGTFLECNRLVSSVLIMPVSRLAKKGFKYGMHAVTILIAWTNCWLIVTGQSAKVWSCERAAWCR